MARIFITGSADGLGQLAAKELIQRGHKVVLHARSEERATQAMEKVPGAEDVLVADISGISEIKSLAAKANALGNFDAVIHNAGVYSITGNNLNADGLPVLFVVNSLAPFILTSLITKPKRLIYLSSGMHLSGNAKIDNLPGAIHNNKISYSDTKLHDVIISMAAARKWTNVFCNAVDPGWVPTKMGGAGATGNLEKGYETQVWLAESNDAEAKVSGGYFHHKKQARYQTAADDAGVQDKFIALCEQLTGVSFT